MSGAKALIELLTFGYIIQKKIPSLLQTFIIFSYKLSFL